MVKIPHELILDDFGINTAESVIVRIDWSEVINRIQTAFGLEFERNGKLDDSNIVHLNYEYKQVLRKITKHIKKLPN